MRATEKSPLREDTDGQLEIIEYFYQKLYTKERACKKSQARLPHNINIKMTEEQRFELDKLIEQKELKKALKDSLYK